MKLTALTLVLLLIYPEVQPQKKGTYKDHTHTGYWEKVPGWDDRWELYYIGPSTGRGGFCYGIAEFVLDPPWLGNTDFLDMDPRSTTPFYDYQNNRYTDYFGTHLSPSTASKLTVYHILHKGKPLYGWFHLKLETTDKTQVSLEQVYAHVETSDDRYAVAGSFVRTKFTKGGCATENAENKYDYKPCQWAHDPFILAHTTFLRRTPIDKGFTTYHWNVRIEFPLCQIYYFENTLYFRVVITHAAQKTKFFLPLQKHIRMANINYGAPDPEPPANADVSCTTEVGNNGTEWIIETLNLERNVSFWGIDCTAESLRFSYEPKERQYSWGGRCGMGFSEPYSQKSQALVPRVTHKYNCRHSSAEYRYYFDDLKNPREFKGKQGGEFLYPEINEYFKQALEQATKNCSDVKCKETVTNQTKEGVSAISTIGRYIFAGRQGHGILMVVACLFVYPLTNFVSRYFKGTFMATRYIANLHPWYAVHIYGTLTTMTLLVTGVGMAIYAREYLGYSFDKAGRIHVLLGYVTCLLFLGGIVSNALRCGNKASWNCSIIVHACFGVLFYYLALVTIAVSVWIPGSPGGQKLKREYLIDKIINSTLVVVTLLFPIFEIIIHVIGTIQMCKRDVRFGVLRDWACFVAIPRVAAGEHNDEAGTGLKSILFVVYLLGASLATIVALGTIGTSNPDGHFFGKMTYTHMNGKLSTQNVPMHQEAQDVLE